MCCCMPGGAFDYAATGEQLDRALGGGLIQRTREGLLSGDLMPAGRTCPHDPVPLETEREAVRGLVERRRARKIVQELVATARARDHSILIYAAGQHTSELLSSTDLAQARIVAICDSNPQRWGSHLKGFTVQPPSVIEPLRPDYILITSMYFHQEIHRQLQPFERQGIRIVNAFALEHSKME